VTDEGSASVSLLSKMALMSRSQLPPELLDGPPPEVLDALGNAWERAQELLIEGLELGFASEPSLGRTWGELRLTDGTLVASLPASEALALACGDALVLDADAVTV
jgi:hypothetical protein